MKGRGIGEFRKGPQVTDFGEVRVGDLLVMYTPARDSINLIRVVSLDDTGLGRDIFYWRYADGDRGGQLFGTEPAGDKASRHAMWGWEFNGKLAHGNASDLYRALPKEPGTIYGILDMYRHYGVRNRRDLDAEVRRRVGSQTAGVRVVGEIGSEQGFYVGAYDAAGDYVDNHFRFPLTEEALSVGLAELLLQVNPDQARAEGEEFLFELGRVRAEMGAS